MSSPFDVVIDLVDKSLSTIKEVKINHQGCESLARKIRSTLRIVLQLDDIPYDSSMAISIELVKDALKEAQDTIDECCQTSLFSRLLYHENHDVALKNAISKLENACAQIPLAQAEKCSDVQTTLIDLPSQLNHMKFEQTAAMAHQVQELRDVLERGFFQKREQLAEVKELVQKLIAKHIKTKEIKAQTDLLMKEVLGMRKEKEAQMDYELNQVIAAMHESMKAVSKTKDRLEDFKDGLLCPISKDTMEDPVILKETGNTYDRSSIQEWFDIGHSKDPLTNVQISSKELVPDLVLQDVCLTILGKPRNSTNTNEPNTKEPASPFEPGLYEGYGRCTSDASTLLVQQMIIFEPNREVLGCSLYKKENTKEQEINVQIGSGHWDGKRLKLHYKDDWYNFSGNLDLIFNQGEYILKWNGRMSTRQGHSQTNDSAFLYRSPSVVMSINLHPGIYQLENAFFNTNKNVTYKAKVMVSLHTNWKVEGWMWLKATTPHPNFEGKILGGKWSYEGSLDFNVVFDQKENSAESQTKPKCKLNGFEILGKITQDEDSSHFSFNAMIAKKSNEETNPSEESYYVPLDGLESLEFLCIRKASTPWNHTHQDPLKVVQTSRNCEVKLVQDIINTTAELNLGFLPYNQDAMNRLSIYTASQQNLIDIFKVLISNGASVHSSDKKGWSLLHLASFYNSINIINDLIAKGTIIELRDGDEWTPLHLASQNNSIGAVKVLIANGVSVEVQNKDGWNSLHIASQNNSIDVVKELIAKGANIKLQDKDGNTALHIGSSNDSIATVKELITNCATIDSQNKDGASPLHCASQQNNIDIAKELIINGADVNLENMNGDSPLYIVSKHNYIDIAKELIANSAELDHQNKDGWTPLHVASQHNSIEVSKELIANGADINHQSKDGSSPLHIATQHNSVDIIKELIAKRAYINLQDKDGWTPLHIAIHNDSIDIAKRLLDARAVIDIQNNNGSSPLHLAMQNNNIPLVKELIAKGAYLDFQDNHGRTLLHMVLQKNMVDIFMDIIERGINVDLQDNDGHSPLHIASQNNTIKVVKELIAIWAKINVQDNDGQTPLHIAIENNYLELVKKLIASEAEVNIQNENGISPLHIASQNNSADVAKELIARGAKLNLQNKNGASPLYVASQMNSIDVAKELIAHGANINLQEKNGASPLYIALQMNSIDVAKELIAHGANIDLQRKDGCSPLCIASQNNSIDVAKELIAHGANVDLQEKNGASPLYIASQMNSIDVAKELIAHGANIDLQNKNGASPLHIASSCGQVTIVKVLLDNGAKKETKNNEGKTPFDVVCSNKSFGPYAKDVRQELFSLLNTFFIS
eukprot:g957.t1